MRATTRRAARGVAPSCEIVDDLLALKQEGDDSDRERLIHKQRLTADVERIKEQLTEVGAEKTVLIGSLATDRLKLTSDIHLLVVIELPVRFLDRQLQVSTDTILESR